MELKQSSGERFVKYLSRLKGASSDSDIILTCKEASNPCCDVEDCGEEINYGKKMVFFQALVEMASHTICTEIMKDIIACSGCGKTSHKDTTADR